MPANTPPQLANKYILTDLDGKKHLVPKPLLKNDIAYKLSPEVIMWNLVGRHDAQPFMVSMEF